MMEWWNALSTVNQAFYVAAAFFSAVFLWQFISSLIGLSGSDVDVDAGPEAVVDSDIDADTGVDVDAIESGSLEEAAESTVAFRILSVRAVLAFCMLFTWAGALYLDAGKDWPNAVILATVWGAGAWVFVALLMYWLRKLAESGTKRLVTALGRTGTVYLNIPPGGQGEVRVTVSGTISVVRARGAGGEGIDSGTPVRVVRVLGGNTIEVRPVGGTDGTSTTQGDTP